ncbi:NADH-ubiquinone oxidoreductase [Alcanivorax sp. JB21]|uniref:complex I subunit 5 family protein n=1 Tax=Alcanivorax limicola TaxID=2874102 RepID=UPI001CBC31B5|nr:proton-conducting transporter membrane subunit [Alcanivorax limicola]MBZ2188470.1 NADH-ubiquinone oxidoreductase [Alcanivorax limicola]
MTGVSAALHTPYIWPHVWLILLPLLAALVSTGLNRSRTHFPALLPWGQGLLLLCWNALTLWLWLGGVEGGVNETTTRITFAPLVGPTLVWTLLTDGPALIMALLTTWIGTATLVHTGLRPDAASRPSAPAAFWPLAWLLMATLNLIWLGADLLTLYIGVEALGLLAVAMIGLNNTPGAVDAALRYLFATLLGSLAYLVGAGLLFGHYGTLELATLAGQVSANGATAAGFGLMLAGLALKAAVFPLHGWLPAAHASALLPVSVLHAALVIKASVFVMLRHWLAFGPAFADTALPLLVGALGAVAILWGSIMALQQTRLKLLIAWSTIAQTGYLLVGFPLLLQGDAALQQLVLQGILYQMVAHGLAKAALFMTAGHLVTATGSDRIDQLTGTGRHLPLTLLTLGLAGVSLMGMPPSAGFVAKWLLASGAIGSGQVIWLVVLLAGGLLSATYILRLLRQAFREGPEQDVFQHPSRVEKMTAFLLALMTLLLGLMAIPLLSLITLPGGGIAP